MSMVGVNSCCQWLLPMIAVNGCCQWLLSQKTLMRRAKRDAPSLYYSSVIPRRSALSSPLPGGFYGAVCSCNSTPPPPPTRALYYFSFYPSHSWDLIPMVTLTTYQLGRQISRLIPMMLVINRRHLLSHDHVFCPTSIMKWRILDRALLPLPPSPL